METVNNLMTRFNNLSKMKQVILVIMGVIVLIFLYNIFTSDHKKQKYSNVDNSKKNSNKIEKLDPKIHVSSGNVSNTATAGGDISLNTEITNVTLYYADWCGHCKQFIGSTWNKVKEKYANNPGFNINQVDCTNIQSEIKTPAGMAIKGFPTVIFNYKNVEGEYVEEEYSGNRSYNAFTNYLDSLGN